jgi:hypothetical protein
MGRTLVAIGTRKGLFLADSRDDRTGWQVEGPFFTMHAVYAAGFDTRPERPRILVGAASDHWGPSVSYSDDLGASWQEAEQGAIRFPEKADATLAQVWQLQPAGPEQPGVVYAGTEPSALFRSTDGGVTFELVEGLWEHPHRPTWQPGGGGQCLHTVVPDPRDPAVVLVAMSTGGVYRTADGGTTWEPSNTGIEARFQPDRFPEYGQCVHKVSRSPVRPDRLYLQNHGGVYRSDDGGTSWTSIGESLPADFGFPIVAHPSRESTAYVFPLVADVERLPAGRRCRVYRTDDAGETWRELGAGLPAGEHYGTVLRDAMTTDGGDPAGLYFGNRNGEVFVSRDEGESWQLLADHLPDVLCVRAVATG